MDQLNTAQNDSSASSESSSLLAQLQGKLKRGLQPTQTKLIHMDGHVSYFQNQGLEKVLVSSAESQQFGFVVDTKPDLTVGEILPNLFVSSQDVPQDLKLIQHHGITHVLSLLPDFELYHKVKPLIKDNLVLEFYDEEIFKLGETSAFVRVTAEALNFIHDASADPNNKVLVHCNAGLSRAPTIAILYLMTKCHYSFDDAWQKVQVARPHAKPNRGFLNYLRSLPH